MQVTNELSMLQTLIETDTLQDQIDLYTSDQSTALLRNI